MNRFLVPGLLLFCAWQLIKNGSQPPAQVQGEPASRQVAVTPFHERLLEIARTYESYGKQQLQTWGKEGLASMWGFTGLGIGLALIEETDTGMTFSASADALTHGRKVFALFVKEHPPGCGSFKYTRNGDPNPIGQVIVMESWLHEEEPDYGNRLMRKDARSPYARKDGKLYRPVQKDSLFIMFKLDPQTPGTDEGWVYGTVSPDRKQVTSAGRVESCMDCHQRAPHDRLFGAPSD